MRGKGADRETGDGRVGVGGSDAQFRRDDQLLPSSRIRCCSRGRSSERVLHDAATLALRSLAGVAWSRILAAASCQTVRCPG